MKPIKMSISEIEKQSDEWKRTHYIMIYGPIEKEKEPKYFTDFKKEVSSFIAEQRKFNKQVSEFMNYVLNQFKKHGWID